VFFLTLGKITSLGDSGRFEGVFFPVFLSSLTFLTFLAFLILLANTIEKYNIYPSISSSSGKA
jgi:hypothetical protein